MTEEAADDWRMGTDHFRRAENAWADPGVSRCALYCHAKRGGAGIVFRH